VPTLLSVFIINDPVNISDYIVTWKGFGRKRSLLNFMYLPGILLNGLRRTTKNLNIADVPADHSPITNQKLYRLASLLDFIYKGSQLHFYIIILNCHSSLLDAEQSLQITERCGIT
jgi:hypothetical protein